MLNMLDFLGEPQALTRPKSPMLNFFVGFRQISRQKMHQNREILNISWVLDRFETKNAPDQGNVKHVWLRGTESLTFPGKC